MATAATLARALRGGRRSGAGAGSHLLLPQIPGIGRRAPLERAAGPFLPRLGVAGGAGGAGGIFRRLFSQESTKPTTTKSDTFIRIDGPFKPINSLDALLDLQGKVNKMGREADLFRKRIKVALYMVSAVAVIIGLGVWSVVDDHKSNKNALEQLKVSVEQTENNLKLRRPIHELNNN
ncbi:unnamed protein product [Urochloa humidicola]